MKEQTVNTKGPTTGIDPGIPLIPDDGPVTPPGTKPVTKLQHLLAKLAGRSAGAKPKTKLQMLLYNMAGGDLDVKPATKDEQLIMDVIDAGITVPGGTKTITKNGTYNVAKFANAKVNVPNPSSGSITITENGTYDVTQKASAVVNVPEPVISQLTIQNDSSTMMSFLGSLEIADGYVCTAKSEVPVSAGYSKTVGVGRTKVGINTRFGAIFRLRISDATKTAEDFDFKYDGNTVVTWYFMLNNGSESLYYGLCSIQAGKLNKSLVISDK